MDQWDEETLAAEFDDMDQAIISKAMELYPDAFELAVQTQDEELFTKVWNQAQTLVIDDIVTGLIEKGYVEPAGMTPNGDMAFCLTESGREMATQIESERQ